MERNKNQGLTLIELVVTVAIIAIFMGIVTSFITSSSNEFRSTSSNAKVQMQTQQIIDELENVIIDANRGVYYAVDDNQVMNDIPSDTSIATTGSGIKQFQIFTIESGSDICNVHTFIWNSVDKTLKYSNNPAPVASANFEEFKLKGTVLSANESLVMDNVNDFCVDLTRVTSGKIVKFYLSTEEKGKKIATEHTVNLRNRVSVIEGGIVVNPNPGDVKFKIAITNPANGYVAHEGETIKPKYEFDDDNNVSAKLPVHWTVTPSEGVTCDISIKESDCEIKNIEGDGTITITVTAYGEKDATDSHSIIVKVEPSEKLEKLEISGAQLVGAGCIYYFGQDWMVSGTTNKGSSLSADEIQDLTWYIDGEAEDNCSLSADRGLGDDTTISIQAKSGGLESNVIKARIARVDIEEYISTIIKKEEQQKLKTIYYEGGEKLDLQTGVDEIGESKYKVSWILRKVQGEVQDINRKFVITDNGEWVISVEVQLDDNAQHIIKDEISFDVKILTNYRVIGPKYLVHENNYQSQMPNGFNLVSSENDTNWEWNQFWIVANDGVKDRIYKETRWQIQQIDKYGEIINSINDLTQFDVDDRCAYVRLIATMKDDETVVAEIPVLDVKINQPLDGNEFNKSNSPVQCIAETVAGNKTYSDNQGYNWEIGKTIYTNQTNQYTWDLSSEDVGNKQIKVTTDVRIPHADNGAVRPCVFTLSDEINVKIKDGESSIKITEAPMTIHIDDKSHGKNYPIDVRIIIDGQQLGDKDYKESEVEWTLAWEDGSTINGVNVIGEGKKILINNVDSVRAQMQEGVRYAVLTARYNDLVSEPVKIAFTKGDTWVANPGETISFHKWDENYQNPNFVEIAVVDELDGAEKIIKPKGIEFNYDILKPIHQYYPVEGFVIILGNGDELKDIQLIKYRYYSDTTSTTWTRELVIYINH